MQKHVLIIATFLFAGACKPLHSNSDFKIINGTDAAGTFPEVVEIELGILASINGRKPSCTATFVSANTAITAARCLLDDKVPPFQPGVLVASVNIVGSQVKALKGYYPPQFSKAKQDDKDIAVLIFPDGTAKQFAELAASSPVVGTDFDIVGYGCNEAVNNTGAGVKRTGKNKVEQFVDGTILFRGPPVSTSTSGASALSCEGDTGGPMFKQGTKQLMGVASDAGPVQNQTKISLYVDTNSRTAGVLFAQAAANGAVIPGINDGATKPVPPNPTPPQVTPTPTPGPGPINPNPTPTPTPGPVKPSPSPKPPGGGGIRPPDDPVVPGPNPGPNPGSNPPTKPAPPGTANCVCKGGNYAGFGPSCMIFNGAEVYAATPIYPGEVCKLSMCKQYFAKTITNKCGGKIQ